jgi:hypothetical protein
MATPFVAPTSTLPREIIDVVNLLAPLLVARAGLITVIELAGEIGCVVCMQRAPVVPFSAAHRMALDVPFAGIAEI